MQFDRHFRCRRDHCQPDELAGICGAGCAASYGVARHRNPYFQLCYVASAVAELAERGLLSRPELDDARQHSAFHAAHLSRIHHAEKTYWQESGLVPPIYLGQPTPNVPVQWRYEATLAYHPFSKDNVRGNADPGERPDIGFINEWSAQAFVDGTQTNLYYSRLYTMGAQSHGASTLLDESTGRIPVLNTTARRPGRVAMAWAAPTVPGQTRASRWAYRKIRPRGAEIISTALPNHGRASGIH